MSSKPLFRQTALERLSSPGEVAHLTRVVRAPHWLTLVMTGLLVAGVVVWAIVGRIPVTVEAPGALVYPDRVRWVQTPHGGRVLDCPHAAGDQVAKGDVLAWFAAPQVDDQLVQARRHLLELQRHDDQQRRLEEQRLALTGDLRADQLRRIADATSELNALADDSRATADRSLQQQRGRLEGMLADARQLVAVLESEHAQTQQLVERGLATASQLTQAKAALLESQSQAAQFALKLSELDVRGLDDRRRHVELRQRIAELELEKKQLDERALAHEHDVSRSRAERRLQIEAARQQVDLLESQSTDQRQIVSPYDGVLLEVAARPGMVLPAGGRVVSLSISPNEQSIDEPLRALAWFPLQAGKQIAIGMPTLVTPTSVERQRYGSIVGRVTRVADFATTPEAAALTVGSSELIEPMARRGGMLEVEIELQTADTPSGFQWTSAGPPMQFVPGTATAARVVVAHRAPISFLLPQLREWFFGPDVALEPPTR